MNEYQIIPLNPQHSPLKIKAYNCHVGDDFFEFSTDDGSEIAFVNTDFIGAMRIVRPPKPAEPVQSPGGTDEQPAGETEAAPG